MALNIKNTEVETLAAEVASLTHVSKTEAIKVALQERREKLRMDQRDRIESTLQWLRSEVWPRVPERARAPITREEEDELLGFGVDGV